MRVTSFASTVLVAASLLFISTSCTKELRSEREEDNIPAQQAKAGEVSSVSARKSSDEQLLKDVRRATARFHSTTQAINAGYIPSNHCVSVPGVGGMGFHWVNPNLVNNTFDPLQPEAVLYAPNADGSLRLVALEYIVLNVGQAAPMFGSQPFDVNGVPGLPAHWSLHVWMYQENPMGMFVPFNPTVSCQ